MYRIEIDRSLCSALGNCVPNDTKRSATQPKIAVLRCLVLQLPSLETRPFGGG